MIPSFLVNYVNVRSGFCGSMSLSSDGVICWVLVGMLFIFYEILYENHYEILYEIFHLDNKCFPFSVI